MKNGPAVRLWESRTIRNIKAIPTTHRGAEHALAAGGPIGPRCSPSSDWKWYYEPLEFDGWIPDFVIDHDYKPVLVDVKPYTSFGAVDELNVKIRHALGVTWANTPNCRHYTGMTL